MATTEAGGEVRTALYRFYDAAGDLLYVGITSDPWRRWREHVLTRPWYPRVKSWTVTWYENEEGARRAELKAIRGERPVFNKAGAPEPRTVRFAVRRETAMAVCTVWTLLPVILAVGLGICHWEWLKWPEIIALIDFPAPLALLAAAEFTPQIKQAAAWLDRHVTDDLPCARASAQPFISCGNAS